MPISRVLRTLSVFLVLFAAAQACFAHAILMKSTPVAKSTVAAGRLPVTLVFNSRIDGRRSRLSLTGPDGKEVALAPTQQFAPEALVTAADRLVPGAYTLHWVVLANDGHITKGDIPFNVK